MKKFVRILVTAVMLAVLGACAAAGGSGGPGEEDTAFPAG